MRIPDAQCTKFGISMTFWLMKHKYINDEIQQACSSVQSYEDYFTMNSTKTPDDFSDQLDKDCEAGGCLDFIANNPGITQLSKILASSGGLVTIFMTYCIILFGFICIRIHSLLNASTILALFTAPLLDNLLSIIFFSFPKFQIQI